MGTNTTIDPDALEVAAAVSQALLEIGIYQSSHSADEMRVESVEALVAAGALSPQTFARIGNHQSRFHGFPKQISQDIAVFDVLLADKTPPLHFVGFADGHVERVDTHGGLLRGFAAILRRAGFSSTVRGEGAERFVYAEHAGRAMELSLDDVGLFVEIFEESGVTSVRGCQIDTVEFAAKEAVDWLSRREPAA